MARRIVEFEFIGVLFRPDCLTSRWDFQTACASKAIYDRLIDGFLRSIGCFAEIIIQKIRNDKISLYPKAPRFSLEHARRHLPRTKTNNVTGSALPFPQAFLISSKGGNTVRARFCSFSSSDILSIRQAQEPLSPSSPESPSPSWFRRTFLFFREDSPCYALAFVSAALLRLAYPRPGWGVVAWVALVPLLMALRARTGWRAFWVTFCFGSCFSYANLFWLHSLTQFNPFIPIGVLLLALALGGWTALAGWGWATARARYGTVLGNFVGTAWWIGVDWLRTLGPYAFPWGALGMTQTDSLPLLQLVSLTGVFGLTFLLMLINGFLADLVLFWITAREKQRLKGASGENASPPLWKTPAFYALMGTAFLTVCLAIWGAVRVRAIERGLDEKGLPFHIAALQPNVPQTLKMASYASPDPQERRSLQRWMTSDFLSTLDELAQSDETLDLVVTPESVVTESYFNRNVNLQRILSERAQDLGAPIYFGADDSQLYTQNGALTEDLEEAINPVTGEPWRHDLFVSAWFISPAPLFDRAAVYHKIRLVPFGEWLPWLDAIPFLQEKIVQVGSFTPGKSPVLFEVPLRNVPSEKTERLSSIRISGGICFESIFPDLHRKMAHVGADVLLNVTNDGWYEQTSGPFQHFQFAVLRAVETGRPLIRCANTGVTAVISPTGRILDRLPFYEKGVLKTSFKVHPYPQQTLYTRWGYRWVIGCLALSATMTFLALSRNRRKTQNLRKNAY